MYSTPPRARAVLSWILFAVVAVTPVAARVERLDQVRKRIRGVVRLVVDRAGDRAAALR